MHKTAIVLHPGATWVGWTRDISAHGINRAGEPFDGEKETSSRWPRPFCRSSPGTWTQRLPHRLVSLNLTRTVLHPVHRGTAERHTGHQFFSPLIESNQNKLKTAREFNRYRMAGALRNLYTHHLFNTPSM